MKGSFQSNQDCLKSRSDLGHGFESSLCTRQKCVTSAAVPNNQCHMVVFTGCHWPQQDEHRFLLDHFMRYHAWVPCILQLTSTPGTQIKCHFKIVLKQPQQPLCSIPVTSKVANLMEQMLRATLHCHQRGMLHRDLKPENFLFTGRVNPSHPDQILNKTHFTISLLC